MQRCVGCKSPDRARKLDYAQVHAPKLQPRHREANTQLVGTNERMRRVELYAMPVPRKVAARTLAAPFGLALFGSVKHFPLPRTLQRGQHRIGDQFFSGNSKTYIGDPN